MLEHLSRLRSDSPYLAAAAVVLVSLVAAYALLLNRPLAAYRAARGARVALEASIAMERRDPTLAAALRRDAESLEGRLGTEAFSVPAPRFQAFVLGRLDEAARRAGVRLTGITPGPTRQVDSFLETLFSVQVVGPYAKSYEWLCEVRRSLAPIAAKEVQVSPESNSEELRMTLTLASYRPVQ
ncbi:MAG: hypothetical protein HY900_32945 [Deltaproteobacteria bacterium]|nr:hypothetical protein [Deltaproteobacteria bacterium]